MADAAPRCSAATPAQIEKAVSDLATVFAAPDCWGEAHGCGEDAPADASGTTPDGAADNLPALARCYVGSTSEGFASVALPGHFGGEYQPSHGYVCVAFCADGDTHRTAIARRGVAMYRDKFPEGFASCGADDCNGAEACGPPAAGAGAPPSASPALTASLPPTMGSLALATASPVTTVTQPSLGGDPIDVTLNVTDDDATLSSSVPISMPIPSPSSSPSTSSLLLSSLPTSGLATSPIGALARCWEFYPLSGQEEGSSMLLPTDQEYNCMSFCLDCASSDPFDSPCTAAQRTNGTQLSVHTRTPRDDLEMTAAMYANSGFMACDTDDCNTADPCTANETIDDTANAPTSSVVPTSPLPTVTAPFAPSSDDLYMPTYMPTYMLTVASPAPSPTVTANDSTSTSKENEFGSFIPIGASPAPSPTATPNNATSANIEALDTLSAPYAMTFFAPGSAASRYGSSVAVSGDGSLVAVGASEAAGEFTGEAMGVVYIYAMSAAAGRGDASLSLLQVLYGRAPRGEFGSAVALSQDGHRIVVGSRSENDMTGAMQVYQRDETAASFGEASTWSVMEGGVFRGQNLSERAGWAVNISADGNVIAMGSPKGGTTGGGSIVAFKYNDFSFTWDQYGSRVQSSTTGEGAGYSISLSDNGFMVVGFPKAANMIGSINAGKVAVYSMSEEEGQVSMSEQEWQVSGQELYGEAQGNLDGDSVAISQDGSVIVIGGKGWSEKNATTGEVILKSAGYCRVFRQEAGWEFLYSIEGKSSEEHLGSSVAVSADGNTVACGGVSGMNANSKKSGVVRLWNRITLQESTIWPREAGNDVDGATFGTSLALSADGEYVIVGAPNWRGANGESSSTGAIQIFSYFS